MRKQFSYQSLTQGAALFVYLQGTSAVCATWGNSEKLIVFETGITSLVSPDMRGTWEAALRHSQSSDLYHVLLCRRVQCHLCGPSGGCPSRITSQAGRRENWLECWGLRASWQAKEAQTGCHSSRTLQGQPV